MISQNSDLAAFGWNKHFDLQFDPQDDASAIPVRVTAVHKNGLHVCGPDLDRVVPLLPAIPADEEAGATAGDWLLIDRDTKRPLRLLHRKSLLKRRAAGTGRQVQLIAANVDTVFIVSSCNQDFNVARLERYLVLVRDAGINPVIVLTKADLSDEADGFARTASRLLPDILVERVDARDPDSVACLLPWCGTGETVALLGSSGVGKSTLVNTLTGSDGIATQGIREDDSKGRHTTTGRALYRLAAGGWLMDTPGMRALQLTDVDAGIADVFSDVTALAENCRFNDCGHMSEPGCAVQAAISAGTLDPARLKRWRKLAAEQVYNTETLAERRARFRSFGKMVKGAMKDKRRRHDT